VRGINEGWRLYWFISRDGGDLYRMHGLTQTDGGNEVCKQSLFLFLFNPYFISFNFICGPKFGKFGKFEYIINTGGKYLETNI
jgi:hypothetical protein